MTSWAGLTQGVHYRGASAKARLIPDGTSVLHTSVMVTTVTAQSSKTAYPRCQYPAGASIFLKGSNATSNTKRCGGQSCAFKSTASVYKSLTGEWSATRARERGSCRGPQQTLEPQPRPVTHWTSVQVAERAEEQTTRRFVYSVLSFQLLSRPPIILRPHLARLTTQTTQTPRMHAVIAST